MAIQYLKALTYPYRKENLVNGLVVLGGAGVINMVFSVAVLLAVGAVSYEWLVTSQQEIVAYLLEWFDIPEGCISQTRAQSQSTEISGHLELPFFIILATGVDWYLFSRFQKEGYGAPIPDWQENGAGMFGAGFRAWFFYLLIELLLGTFVIGVIIALFYSQWVDVFQAFIDLGCESMDALSDELDEEITAAAWQFLGITIPFLLMVLVVRLLLVPFVAAPMVHSAQTRRFGDLWNFSKAVEITMPRYMRIYWANLLMILTGLIYLIPMIPLVCCWCFGGFLVYPFLITQYRLTCTHLLAQAFDLNVHVPESSVNAVHEETSPQDEPPEPSSTDPS